VENGQVTITIAPERPDTPDSRLLIDELEMHLAPYYPQENRFGYSVEKLMRQGVAFFVTRVDGVAAGCGGVQFFGTEYGELKRMFVRTRFRGLGLAKRMLGHLEKYALQHGIPLMRLETGIHQTEAIGLYERMGYRRCAAFGEYTETHLNIFFEKRLV
jgi:GNAT superfamily N-acetyltransferase